MILKFNLLNMKEDSNPTKASIAEAIELRFFHCESRLRDHLTRMVNPYVSQARDI